MDVLINQITCSGDSNFIFQNSIESCFIYADLNLPTETFEIIDHCYTLIHPYLNIAKPIARQRLLYLIDGFNSLDSVPISTTLLSNWDFWNRSKPNIDAGEDIFVLPGTEIQLQFRRWFPLVSKLSLDSATSYSPYFTANTTTDLLLTTTDSNGCEYQDIVRVYVEPLWFFIIP